MSRPPDRFRRLLLRVLPDGVTGESIVGDLDQELRETIDAGRSPRRARLWYRWEATKLALRWSLEGLRTARITRHDDTGGWAMGWTHDVKYGFRMLLKSPLVTLVAAVSIALGIGASASMFSVYFAFLHAPLPYPDQEELLLVQQPDRESRFDAPAAPGAFHELVEAATSFESWAAWRTEAGNLTGGEEPVRISVVETHPRTLEALQRQPFMGRGFTLDDGRPGAAPTAILHYDLWSSRFAQDPNIVGQTVGIDGAATTVIGVMPEDFDLLSFSAGNIMAMVPDDFQDERQAWADRSLTVVGRLRPGASREAATAELTGIFDRLRQAHGGELEDQVLRTKALREEIPGESDTALVQVLLAVGLFVLFLAAANVANLLLARAEGRQGEVSIRLALGAGRVRLLRQLLTESVLLALVGAAAGTVLTVFGVRGIDAALPAQVPDLMRPELGAPVIVFTLGLAVLTGVLLGLAPALQSLRANLKDGLGEGRSRGGTADRKRRRLRNTFVAGQVAVALALLVGASALVSLADDMVNADPGFRAEGLLTFHTSIPEQAYPEDADVVRLLRDVQDRLGSISGVRSVAVMEGLPRGQTTRGFSFRLPEDARDPDASDRISLRETVNPAWFQALDVELQSGRLFDDSDGPDDPKVAVVNVSFARRHFPDRSPLGRPVIRASSGEEVTIIGVVEDVMHTRVPLGEEFSAVVYLPLAQSPRRAPALAVRAEGDPGRLAPEVRQAVWSVDPELPVSDVQTLPEFIHTEMAAPRFLGGLLLGFGALALVLSGMGIWGVMAHNVARRTRELGIRMALGAKGTALVGLVSKQGLVLTAAGLALGTPLAWLVLRAAGGVTAEFDADLGSPALYVTVGAALLAVALLASWVPSMRAARVDPREALAAE